jgi:hypothetical protein
MKGVKAFSAAARAGQNTDRDKYNLEGYPDPTAHRALENILQCATAKKKRKRSGNRNGNQKDTGAENRNGRPFVYVCSPYAGNIEQNTKNACRYCRFAAGKGAVPIAPHLLYPQFLDDGNPGERALGLSFGLSLLGVCSEVWVFGGHVSPGMAAEIDKAKRKGIALRYFADRRGEVSPYGR